MKNIHEILKSYDIEIPADKKAEFDKAVLENYKTVAEAEKLRTARDTYKSQLDDATQKLEGFKGVNVEELQGKITALTDNLASQKAAFDKQLDDATQKLEGFNGVNVEELQGKISALTDDLASQKAAFDKQLADRDFDDMLNAAINGSKAKNVKAVRALLDLEAIKASKNQSADIEAALKKVKEENDYLCTSEEPIDNGQFVGGTTPNPTVKTLDDLDKMSYSEYKKYREGN